MERETKRLNIAIDSEIAKAVETLATVERRPVNLQIEVLLIEALAARGIVENPAIPKIDL